MNVWVGVDIGGTFTDVVVVSSDLERIWTGKYLSTAVAPAQAVVVGVEDLLRRLELPASAVERFVHATTLVANDLIERRGAVTALVTTAGVGDVLEFGRESRYDAYDLHQRRPEPLAPRTLRLELDERVDATGSVLRGLDDDEVRRVLGGLAERGVESAAVALLHSYRNPAHERRVQEIAAEVAPGLDLSLSSEVCPEIGEYERMSTTVANAYVRPRIRSYLQGLGSRLEECGVPAPVNVMLSEGGIAPPEVATRYPVRLVESGPAAGVAAATHLARLLGERRVVAFDMGGTTAKICFIDEGQPSFTHRLEVARVHRFKRGSGLPLHVPSVDMLEIGAGGGSIADTDALGLLRVGPRSAGASPGPACYGQGGDLPTVSDANLVLGFLSADRFLGGRMRLDEEAARTALQDRVGAPLGIEVEAAAVGVFDVVNETMASALRLYAAETGRDLGAYTMIPFGGAGPVHAFELARIVGVRKLVYPTAAPTLSALGLIVTPPSLELTHSHWAALDDVAWPEVAAALAALEAEARDRLATFGLSGQAVLVSRTVEVRYEGQGHQLEVSLPGGALGPDTASAIQSSFASEYRRLFGRELGGARLEVLTWRVRASGAEPGRSWPSPGDGDGTGEVGAAFRRVYQPAEGGFAECPVLAPDALRRGAVTGPALIEMEGTTIVIGSDAGAGLDGRGNLVVER